MPFRRFFALLPAILMLASCSRDPEVVKRKYLDNGNRYLAQGKLKEASLMFRSALRKDPKFGEAYAKLGETEVKRGEWMEALRAYRRALDLMPNNQEVAGRLADIYLAGFASSRGRETRWLEEASNVTDILFKRDPKSFQGWRIRGMVGLARNEKETALAALRQADSIKPGQLDVRLALAQLLSSKDEFAEAEKIASALIESYKAAPGPYDYLFVEYMRRNRQADAERILNLKIQNNPAVMNYVMEKASLLYIQKRREELFQIVEKLVGDRSKFPDALLAAGDFFMRVREAESALKYYERGSQQDTARKNVYLVRMVLAQSALNRPAEALILVETILREDPKNDAALELRATLQLRSGDQQKVKAAITDLNTLIQRNPQNPVFRYNLGLAEAARGQAEAARVQFNEAIKLRNDFVAARLALAGLEMQKGDFGRVIQEADQVLKFDPRNMRAKVLKSTALVATGNYRDARLQVEAAMKEDPNSPDLRFQLAVLDLNEGRLKNAEGALNQLRKEFPNDPRPVLSLAELNLAGNRKEDALKLIQEEIKRYPNRQDLHFALVQTAVRANQLDLASAELRHLIGLNPNSFELYMRLGEILRKQGDIKGSLEVLTNGQKLAPNSSAAALQLAMTFEYAGQLGQARPLYQNVLKIEPDNAIAMNNLAYMMAEEGRNLDEALTYAQRAKQRLPNDIDVADTLGWIYIKRNQSDMAISIFRELTQKQPGRSTFHYHLAMAYFQKGDRPRAKQSLQTALGLKPSKAEEAKIRELLAKVG